MAFDINPTLVLRLKSLSNWRGLVRHRLRKQINFVRSRNIARKSSRSPQLYSNPNAPSDAIADEFDRQTAHFNEHGWAYIPQFFSTDVHRAILSAWPKLSHFSVGSDPTKSYDKGPSWSEGKVGEFRQGIEPDFYLGFLSLVSRDFENRVSRFCNDGISRVNTGLGSAWARTGSLLLPHIDDVWRFGQGAVINFVIFVDGSVPVAHSGATAIYSTNTYQEPIFIPPSLTNTALVYETGRMIYHGFPRVGRGNFSKRLIAQYSPFGQPRLSEIRISRRNGE